MRAEAVTTKSRISRAFFDEMPQAEKNDITAKWLKRKTMKRWHIVSLYHLSADNISIDYLIVEAKYPFKSVNPSNIERTVKMTLENYWYIFDKNESIALKMFMNMYEESFVVHSEIPKVPELPKRDNRTYISSHFSEDHGRLYNLMGEDLLKPDDILLYKVSMGLWEPFEEVILITNLFFCIQVDLLPEEFEDYTYSIFFKVKNVTLYNFRRINSLRENSSLEKPGIYGGSQTVRVCLHEFGITSNVADSNYTFETDTYAFYIAVYIWINYVALQYNYQ